MKVVKGGEAVPTLFALVYSMAKMYKTSLMLGIPPALRPVAYLDTDLGARMRLNVLSKTPEERAATNIAEDVPDYYGPWIREGIDFFYPEQGNYYGDMWEFATKVCTSGKYKTAIVDTASRLGREVLNEVKNTDYGGGNRLSIQGKKGDRTVQATMGDYGLAQTRILDFMMALNEAPVHVILISHEKTGEIKDTDTVKRVVGGPATIGTALLEIIPAMMDIVLRLENKPVKVKVDDKWKIGNRIAVRAMNHGIFTAGDRGGLFNDGDILDPRDFWNKMATVIDSATTPKEESKT